MALAAGEENRVGESGAHRTTYWGAVIGGAITIVGGVLLAGVGLLFVGAYIHDANDILIPLTAAVLSGSALSIIGGFDALAPRHYLRALVGSAMPAAFFLGGYVTALYAQVQDGWLVLLLLGMMGASGVFLVASSREAFLNGNDFGEEEWRKRLVESFWGVLGAVVILIVSMTVAATLVPYYLSGIMCLFVPVLIGLLCFLLYIQWLKLRYGIRRRN